MQCSCAFFMLSAAASLSKRRSMISWTGFGDGGSIIDQPFHPRLPEGMIRCYMGIVKIVGLGHQLHAAQATMPLTDYRAATN